MFSAVAERRRGEVNVCREGAENGFAINSLGGSAGECGIVVV